MELLPADAAGRHPLDVLEQVEGVVGHHLGALDLDGGADRDLGLGPEVFELPRVGGDAPEADDEPDAGPAVFQLDEFDGTDAADAPRDLLKDLFDED